MLSEDIKGSEKKQIRKQPHPRRISLGGEGVGVGGGGEEGGEGDSLRTARSRDPKYSDFAGILDLDKLAQGVFVFKMTALRILSRQV